MAEAVGTPTAGCLLGGEAIEAEGPGFRLLFAERRRHFAHPELARWLRATAATHQKAGALRIGDMSREGGGPMPDGHASHQTGIDVDIAYHRERDVALQPGQAPLRTVLKRGTLDLDPDAYPESATALLLALAADPRVERVFVTPAVKRHLCETPAALSLAKIRPWWGHDGHFHVRLVCPRPSPDCVAGDELPADSECGAPLDWWFSAEARSQARERLEGQLAPPTLPERCRSSRPRGE